MNGGEPKRRDGGEEEEGRGRGRGGGTGRKKKLAERQMWKKMVE